MKNLVGELITVLLLAIFIYTWVFIGALVLSAFGISID